MAERVMPSSLKCAGVILLLMKAGMDAIKKIMERRTEHYIWIYDLFDRYQSAYCKDQSTWTALIKVHSAIFESLDGGPMAALILFYLLSPTSNLEFTFGIEP